MIFDNAESYEVEQIQYDQPEPSTEATWAAPSLSNASTQHSQQQFGSPDCPSQPGSFVDSISQQNYSGYTEAFGTSSETTQYPDASDMDLVQELQDLLEADPAPNQGHWLSPTSTSSSLDSGTGSSTFLGQNDINEIDFNAAVDFADVIGIGGVFAGDDEDDIFGDFGSGQLCGAQILQTLDSVQPQMPLPFYSFGNLCTDLITSDGSDSGSAVSPKPTPALPEPLTLWVPENEAPRREDRPTNMANMFAIVFLIIAVLIIRYFF